MQDLQNPQSLLLVRECSWRTVFSFIHIFQIYAIFDKFLNILSQKF